MTKIRIQDREDAMMGAGGKIRVPLSEVQELTKAIDFINNGEYATARAIITRLRSQVQAGYHRNPLHFLAGTAVGKIGKDVHDIRYIHAKDGKPYEHEFNGDVEVYAVQRGDKKDLLLTHRRGSPLWQEFP